MWNLAQLQNYLNRLGTSVLDLLYPPRCVGCQRWGEWLCTTCRGQIALIQPPWCPCCGRPMTRAQLCNICRDTPSCIQGIRAVAYYEGVLRDTIHHFKYRNKQMLAAPLASLLVDYLAEYPISADVIVPVPLHPRRLAERGYNQSALLAQCLSQALGWPVIEDSLIRVHHTQPQVEQLDAQARRENVQAAFVCQDNRLANAQVLLIDDVYTTGATLQACGQALRQRGVRSVWALTLAHGR